MAKVTPINVTPITVAKQPADEQNKKSRLKSLIIRGAIILALIAGAYKAYDYVIVGRYIVSTDDAYITADMAVLSAKVSGYVSDVKVQNNQQVKTGDVLLAIDAGDYTLAVASAKAKLGAQQATIDRIGQQILGQSATIDQAKAQTTSAQAETVRAQAEFDRAVTLAKQDFGSKQRLEQTRADRDKSIAALASAKAGIAAANGGLSVLNAQKLEAESMKADLNTSIDKAQRDLSFTTIKAPFDGIIGNRAAQPGQYVQPGTRLMGLVPLQSVYIEANLKETQLGLVKIGQKASITVDALGGRRFEGEVESFAPATGSVFSLLPPENATGNFTKIVQRIPVRIKLPPEIITEGRLRSGLSAVVEINTKEK